MIFLTKDGTTIDARTVGEHPQLTAGYHWQNSEPLGETPIWREVAGTIPTVDPNHRTLFGYDETEFLAKQYKQ